jgi:large subunit ribosomal protein L1
MPVPVPPTADIESLLNKYRKTVVIKMRNQPIIQCRVGTESMKEEEITENIQAVLRVLEGKLKRGMKNIKLVCIKTTMGAPVKIRP